MRWKLVCIHLLKESLKHPEATRKRRCSQAVEFIRRRSGGAILGAVVELGKNGVVSSSST